MAYVNKEVDSDDSEGDGENGEVITLVIEAVEVRKCKIIS